MKISTRGRYGLRALIDIAANDENVITLNSVAKRQGLSENYLEQIVSSLKKGGFVKSVRGAQGGYILSCSPAETTVGDILRTLEGSLYPVDCLSDMENSSCGSADCSCCVTKPVWSKVYESINDAVDSITLLDLVNDYKENRKGAVPSE